MLLICPVPPKGREAYVWHQNERADGSDSPRMWAGRSARAQNRLGFRVLCYGC
jgi:hypothetical protein